MARYNHSVWGTIIGRVGEGVGSRFRGVKCLRSYNPAPNQPNTEGQQRMKARFKSVVPVARRLFADFCRQAAAGFSRGQSQYNRLVGEMIHHAVAPAAGTSDPWTVKEPPARIPSGGGVGVAGLKVVRSNTAFTVTWENPAWQVDRGNDFVSILVIDKELQGALRSAPVRRKDCKVEIPIEAPFTGSCYLYAVAHKGGGRCASGAERMEVK